MRKRFGSRRGIVDLLLAALLAIGSLFLPAVQNDKAFNRAAAPGTEVVVGR